MKNLRQIKQINATYMRVFEGEGIEDNPYREEEYIYINDQDKLFIVKEGNKLERVYPEGEE